MLPRYIGRRTKHSVCHEEREREPSIYVLSQVNPRDRQEHTPFVAYTDVFETQEALE